MNCPLDELSSPRGTLGENPGEVAQMARSRNSSRSSGRTRPKRRHRRSASGRLEIPYDPDLDDRSFLEELEAPSRSAPLQTWTSSDQEEEYEDDRDEGRTSARGSKESARGSKESARGSEESARGSKESARGFAERKADLTIEAAKKAAVVLVLLITPLQWLGIILMIVWGISLSRKYFGLVVEPSLRERLVEDEVQKQVHVNVSEERRSLEGEHSRDLEQLSASIAHEIRNPITAAKSLVQQMSEEPNSEDNPEYARVAVEELARVERSITHLLRFARDEEMRVAEVAMIDVLDSALETFRDRAARDHVEITKHYDTDGVVEGDADKLRRIIINLVGNGIDALADARVASPRMDISMGENLAGSEVWVRIRDNGVGIPVELREKIFSPFVTSKSGGTGLGLPITKKLVEAHGGSIELGSEAGQGTEFVLTIPKRGR